MVGTVAVAADWRSMPPTSMTTVVNRYAMATPGVPTMSPAVAVIQNIRGVASNGGRGPETATAALAPGRPVLAAELGVLL